MQASATDTACAGTDLTAGPLDGVGGPAEVEPSLELDAQEALAELNLGVEFAEAVQQCAAAHPQREEALLAAAEVSVSLASAAAAVQARKAPVTETPTGSSWHARHTWTRWLRGPRPPQLSTGAASATWRQAPLASYYLPPARACHISACRHGQSGTLLRRLGARQTTAQWF